jgi:alpha-tubulin suppressor-like RCC1 family protein
MNRTRILATLALSAAFLLPGSFFSAPRKQGHAWSWGIGLNGELGTGCESNSSLPQLIKNLTFVDIDSKKSFSAAVTSEGRLFTWGKNRNGALGHSPPNLNVLLPHPVDLP